MKKKYAFLLLLFCLSSLYSETVILENNIYSLNMGETQVLVEVRNLQIIQNEKRDKNNRILETSKIIYTTTEEEPTMKLVLICNWYERAPWDNPTSIFIIKTLPLGETELDFENHEYTIQYDSIRILEYVDIRDDWAKYGKTVTKSKEQKIYNPAFDTILKH